MLGHSHMGLCGAELLQTLSRIGIQFLAGGLHPGESGAVFRALLLHRLEGLLRVLDSPTPKHIHFVLEPQERHSNTHPLLPGKGHRLARIGDTTPRGPTPLSCLLEKPSENAFLLRKDAPVIIS